MNIKNFVSTVALLGMSFLATQAFAHAALEAASPKPGATLDASPKEIRLQFNEQLEATFSTIKLSDPKGSDVAGVKVEVDKADMKVMHAVLPPLPAGAYAVHWSTMTRDGHKTKGSYTFTVK